MPTGRICRASSWRVPRLVQKVGLAWSTTRAPCASGIGMALTAFIGTETDRRHVDVRVAQGEERRAAAGR